MKFKRITSLLLLPVLSLFLHSCGGDSDGINVDLSEYDDDSVAYAGYTSTDPAPATLEGIILDIATAGDVRFQFTQISGDADTQEVGSVQTVNVSTAELVTGDDSTGTEVMREYPDTMTGITYTYQKTAVNTGFLQISGNGTADGTGDADIFVDQPDGSAFIATFDIIFGTSGEVVDNMLMDITVTDETGDVVTYTRRTSEGIELSLSNGTAVPVGYGAVAEFFPSGIIYPSRLLTSGTLNMTFDTNDEDVSSYSLFSPTPDYFVYNPDDLLLDDGYYNASINLDDGVDTFTYSDSDVNYTWTEVTNAEADLQIELNRYNLESEFIGYYTEVYRFAFDSSNSGTFSQSQGGSKTGTFNFPDVE